MRHQGSPHTCYRPDIDGLRAIAILAVVFGHVNPTFLPGGFVGVDVFFVISGFLITRIILSEIAEGRFSLLGFFARRIRRLFPALLVVLLAVWAWGWFFLLPEEFVSLGRYITAGAAFYGNILANYDVGYFDPPAVRKPLLHLWSLGVEEQFYILYPAFLIYVLRYGRALVPFALLLLILLSFGLNITLVQSQQPVAFYLPITRLWEFSIGGIIAYVDLFSKKLNHRKGLLERNILSGIGLLLLIAAIILVENEKFPGWWALLPTLGASLLIAAGPRATINRKVLANPSLVFIGLISYPLYLWHWPLLLAANKFATENRIAAMIVALVVAFVISWLTYRFIEQPVRSFRPSYRRLIPLLSSCMFLVALLGGATVLENGFLSRYSSVAQKLLMPNRYTLGKLKLAAAAEGSGPLMILWGDSHADHLFEGFHGLQRQRQFRIVKQSWSSCAPVQHIAEEDVERCRRVNAEAAENMTKLKPDIVVIGAFWEQYSFPEKTEEMVRFLKQIGVPRVVIIGTVPIWTDTWPEMLYKEFARNPTSGIPKRMNSYVKDSNNTKVFAKTLNGLAKKYGAIYIDPFDILCNQLGCLTWVGNDEGDILQFDMTHLTPAGSRYFVNIIESKVFP